MQTVVCKEGYQNYLPVKTGSNFKYPELDVFTLWTSHLAGQPAATDARPGLGVEVSRPRPSCSPGPWSLGLPGPPSLVQYADGAIARAMPLGFSPEVRRRLLGKTDLTPDASSGHVAARV